MNPEVRLENGGQILHCTDEHGWRQAMVWTDCGEPGEAAFVAGDGQVAVRLRNGKTALYDASPGRLELLSVS